MRSLSLPRSVRPFLVAQSTHNSGPPGHDDVRGRGHWPSAEQTLDMIDLPLSSSDRSGRRPLFLHENGFQMEVVIERDLEDDGLFLGRVERERLCCNKLG